MMKLFEITDRSEIIQLYLNPKRTDSHSKEDTQNLSCNIFDLKWNGKFIIKFYKKRCLKLVKKKIPK